VSQPDLAFNNYRLPVATTLLPILTKPHSNERSWHFFPEISQSVLTLCSFSVLMDKASDGAD